MISKIFSDIEKSLDAEAYIAALALILILPDMCAKAEYGNTLNNKERYIAWYDEYVGKYETLSDTPENSKYNTGPYLSGEIVYQLRCAVLHQGTICVDKAKIREGRCKIDNLTLIVHKKDSSTLTDSSSVITYDDGTEERFYKVNIHRLYLIIGTGAKNYFEDNKSKFSYLSYNILDWDQERIDSHWV